MASSDSSMRALELPAPAALQAREFRAAVGLFARAFAQDPILTHYYRDGRRGLAYRLLFGDLVLAHRAHGHADALRDGARLVAVALWSPPDGATPPWRERLRASLFSASLRLLFPRAAAPLGAGFERLSHLHPREPHWYLAFIGVEPAYQGLGLGAKLLAPVIARADDQERACYLETPFPRTHRFYQRLGFELTGEHRPFEGAPPVWTFLRPPAGRVNERPARFFGEIG